MVDDLIQAPRRSLIRIRVVCSNRPTEHYGFVARLGRDTVSVESVTRTGNTLVIDEDGLGDLIYAWRARNHQ